MHIVFQYFRAVVFASVIVALLFSFARTAEAQDERLCLVSHSTVESESNSELQRQYVIESLQKIYHGGYRTPEGLENALCMNQAQLERAQQRFQILSETEKAVLDARYCEVERDLTSRSDSPSCDNELVYWALRDTDNDGILDFRVKELGSFIQNDPDADNDGVENLMDLLPLETAISADSAFADADADGLPDHLDWSNAIWHDSFAQKSERLVEIQKQIFDDFGIVLIEAEGSEISEKFADMTLDVLQVFRNMYEVHDASRFTRSITLARQYDFDPFGVLAEVSPVNGQVLVFEYGIENLLDEQRNLVAPFMVYIHEFAHVIQNAMDFPDNMQSLLRFNAHNNAPNFIQAVRQMDWTIPMDQEPSLELTDGFVDHGSEPVGFAEVFRETSLGEIQQVCRDAAENVTAEMWAQYNIVSCYSLHSVREWHAEYIATTVLRKMFQHLRNHYPFHSAAMIDLAQETMFEDWGGANYDYENADNRITALIEEELDLEEEMLETISHRYLVEPYLIDTELTLADVSVVEWLTDR